MTVLPSKYLKADVVVVVERDHQGQERIVSISQRGSRRDQRCDSPTGRRRQRFAINRY